MAKWLLILKGYRLSSFIPEYFPHKLNVTAHVVQDGKARVLLKSHWKLLPWNNEQHNSLGQVKLCTKNIILLQNMTRQFFSRHSIILYSAQPKHRRQFFFWLRLLLATRKLNYEIMKVVTRMGLGSTKHIKSALGKLR